jgi:hypothetical protein
MPTLLRILGYIFSFYSNENKEPPHVHVEKGGAEGKIWLEPEVKEEFFLGFNPREKREIKKIVEENSETFKKKWYDYFKK